MNKTAIIYTKEEAQAMLPKDRPICYRVTSKIYHAAFEAAGHASLCWKPRPDEPLIDGKPVGVFDTEEASKAALDMLFVVAEEMERLGITFQQLNQLPQVESSATITPKGPTE
jgi:hypothetical protein